MPLPALLASPALWGGVASAAGSIFGGSKAASSARDINRQQIALSREQMQFQERMSNTAYQRSTADLKKAGLNRILALGSPSSSPGGAQPPSLKVPGEHIARGVSSALQNANIGAQIALTNAQTKKVTNEGLNIAPKALMNEELLKLLQRLIPAAKTEGPGIVSKITDQVGTSAKDFGTKIGILDAKPKRAEQSSLIGLEITFNPRANETKNVADWASHFERTKNKKPTEEQIRRAAAEIRSMLKRNRR